jgi:hypothetical protein
MFCCGTGGGFVACRWDQGAREIETTVTSHLNCTRVPERWPDAFAAAVDAYVLLCLAGSLGFRSRPLSRGPRSSSAQASGVALGTGSRGCERAAGRGSRRGRTKNATSVGALARSCFDRRGCHARLRLPGSTVRGEPSPQQYHCEGDRKSHGRDSIAGQQQRPTDSSQKSPG